jgi:hypothetical protein
MRRLTAVLMAFLTSTGCSFALVSGPPANHQQLPVIECTTSRVGPILDTVWSVLQTLNLVAAIAQDEESWQDQFHGDAPFSRNAAIGIYSSFAALGAAGMWYGYSGVSECRAAKQELAIRARQQPTPGQGGAEPWPPRQPGPPRPLPRPRRPLPRPLRRRRPPRHCLGPDEIWSP